MKQFLKVGRAEGNTYTEQSLRQRKLNSGYFNFLKGFSKGYTGFQI